MRTSLAERESESMNVVIRPACAADREHVLAFTRNTWPWGDYIEEAWDGWLSDPRGGLVVAEADGQPVGMAMCTRPSDDEGWLQGLRVHPDYRRHGIARALTAYQIDWLRDKGATVARLAVYVSNLASQNLVASTGFRHVTTFVEREQPAALLADSAAQADVVAADDEEAAWAWLTASPTFLAAAGLWANHWTWQRLTRRVFAEQVQRGQVLGVRRDGAWKALAIALLDDEGQHIAYADGAGAAVDELARALSTRAWPRCRRRRS